jgi:hypothetical protein
MKLPEPFNTFRLEKQPGEYKDFQVAEGDPYPLKGVTYPVSYGDIDGFTGEDGHPLDVFVGEDGDIFGYFQVARPDVTGGKEHKFYLFVTEDEETAIFKEFAPVLLDHARYNSLEELQQAVQPFKNES